MFDLGKRSNEFKSVFLGTEEGKRVLAHVYKMCNMDKQIHVSGAPHDTSFNAGSHRVGQGISSILGQSQNEIMQLVKNLGNGSPEIENYDPYNK